MTALRQFVVRNFYTIMYLLVAGSFLGLVAELVWTEHWDGIQLVGLAASAIGLVLALLAIFASARMRSVLAILFLVLSISGIVGAIEHNEARNEESSATVIMAASVGPVVQPAPQYDGDEEGEEHEEEGEGENVPPLAPLSLAGMSIIGAVTLLADDRKRK